MWAPAASTLASTAWLAQTASLSSWRARRCRARNRAPPIGVGPPEEGLESGGVVGVLQQRQLVRFDRPAGFAEEGAGVDGAGDGVEHAAFGGAEVAGDVAALLLAVDNAEGADLLEGGDE